MESILCILDNFCVAKIKNFPPKAWFACSRTGARLSAINEKLYQVVVTEDCSSDNSRPGFLLFVFTHDCRDFFFRIVMILHPTILKPIPYSLLYIASKLVHKNIFTKNHDHILQKSSESTSQENNPLNRRRIIWMNVSPGTSSTRTTDSDAAAAPAAPGTAPGERAPQAIPREKRIRVSNVSQRLSEQVIPEEESFHPPSEEDPLALLFDGATLSPIDDVPPSSKEEIPALAPRQRRMFSESAGRGAAGSSCPAPLCPPFAFVVPDEQESFPSPPQDDSGVVPRESIPQSQEEGFVTPPSMKKAKAPRPDSRATTAGGFPSHGTSMHSTPSPRGGGGAGGKSAGRLSDLNYSE